MSEQHYIPLYFQEWNSLRNKLNAEQGWKLILRCLDYAQGNELPEEDDPVVYTLFSLLSSNIDRNMETVANKKAKARYARYCSECKSSGVKPLTFDQWSLEIDARRHPSTNVNGRQHPSTPVDNHNQIIIESNHNHNHNQNHNPLRVNDAPSSDSHDEIQNERFVNGEYKPQLWECEIPKMFWGKFKYEDDYYAYAEEHRDEIIKMLDEMENVEGKQPD